MMSRWFVLFILYSLGGYGLEKLHALLSHSPRQVRKCFLLLPLCPVYGLAMILLLAAAPAESGFFPLALLGGMVCTGVEYLVHLFYDKCLGVRFWDYSALPGHLHGRVCPRFTLLWGALSAAAVRIAQPGIGRLAGLTPGWLAFLLWMTLAVDGVFSAAVLIRYGDTEMLTVRRVVGQIWASSQSKTSL